MHGADARTSKSFCVNGSIPLQVMLPKIPDSSCIVGKGRHISRTSFGNDRSHKKL